MFDTIVRSEQEIENVYDEAMNSIGDRFHGMTYEEGVTSVLDWLFGRRKESPMED